MRLETLLETRYYYLEHANFDSTPEIHACNASLFKTQTVRGFYICPIEIAEMLQRKDISPEEQQFYERFREYKKPPYIVATTGRNFRDTLQHEVAHHLYRIDRRYRARVDGVLKQVNNDDILKMKEVLIQRYLYNSVYFNEIQARLIGNPSGMWEDGLRTPDLQRASKVLRKIFFEHVDLNRINLNSRL